MANHRDEHADAELAALLEKRKLAQLHEAQLIADLNEKIEIRKAQIKKHHDYHEHNQKNRLFKEWLERGDHAADFLVALALFLEKLLQAVPIISVVINGAKNIMYAATTWSMHEGIYTKGVKTITGVSAAALIMASVVFAFLAPELGLAMAAIAAGVEVLRELWIMTAAIVTRINGSWSRERKIDNENKKNYYQLIANHPESLAWLELRRQLYDLKKDKSKNVDAINILEKQCEAIEKTNPKFYENFKNIDKQVHKANNYQRHRDGELAGKIHLFLLNTTVLIGAALFATPLAPLGAAILIVTSMYGISHGFDFPAKWASRIKNYFFGKKKPESVHDILLDANKNGINILEEHAHKTQQENLINDHQKTLEASSEVIKNATTSKIYHELHTVPHSIDMPQENDEVTFVVGNPTHLVQSLNKSPLSEHVNDDDDGDSDSVKPLLK